MEENLLKTCLYDKHTALGALMSPFGGFMMPIQYTNITNELLDQLTEAGDVMVDMDRFFKGLV